MGCHHQKGGECKIKPLQILLLMKTFLEENDHGKIMEKVSSKRQTFIIRLVAKWNGSSHQINQMSRYNNNTSQILKF